MKPGLEGVDLKIARANQHLTLLETERLALLKRAGGRMIGHIDVESGDYIFCVDGDAPPLSWGIEVGAFAHALRSALDNLLWQVILVRGGMPGKETQFPIYEDESVFREDTKRDRSRARRATEGVKPPDFAFIESTQPFNAGGNATTKKRAAKWHPLALLSYLNNTDKHRFVPASYAAAQMIAPTQGRMRPMLFAAAERIGVGMAPHQLYGAGFSFRAYYLDGTQVDPPGQYMLLPNEDDPTQIVRVVTGARPHTEMYMNPGPSFDISFSDRERPMQILDLIDIRDAVVQVVEHFRPAFG